MSTQTNDKIKFDISNQKGLNEVIKSEKEYVSMYYKPYSQDERVKTADCYYVKYVDRPIKS